MTGCRIGAKNTLDRNYLHLAEHGGAKILAETEVTAVRRDGAGGYRLETRPAIGGGEERVIEAERVVFAGGVMGTVPLLLAMREDPQGLPDLSPRVGDFVRTNNESLIGIITPNADENFCEGVAITSILHTDDHSHVEPVRYGEGSSFFRPLVLPHTPAPTLLGRMATAARGFLGHPIRWARALTIRNFSRQSQILLYMRTLESTLSLRLGRSAWTGFRRGLVSTLDDPADAPKAFMEEATDIARRFADKVGGVAISLATEALAGTPTTAHILGGACMGTSAEDGVIDAQHRVFGYDGLYVIDGSAVSANPGVNPSLTITALAERAMTFIPDKD
jgi:cholesterol oxidase